MKNLSLGRGSGNVAVPAIPIPESTERMHFVSDGATEDTVTVPTGAKLCLITISSGNYFVHPTAAIIPSADATSDGQMVNPVMLNVDGETSFEIISDTNGAIIGIAFWD